jgi:hypothetical protein
LYDVVLGGDGDDGVEIVVAFVEDGLDTIAISRR